MALIKPVEGYEGLYLVTDEGKIYSLPRIVYNGRGKWTRPMRELKPGTRAEKYKFVILNKDGESKSFSVHSLVARAFLENPYGYTEINHKDENPANNRADNLEWCSRQYNIDYSKSKAIAQYEMDGTKIAEYKSISYASRITGILRQAINNAVCGESHTAGGYRWKYVERGNDK